MSKLRELYNYGGAINVLFVEDDLDLLHFTKELLDSIFNNVEIATNGKEGLDLYKTNNKKFDLIITDINMPIMDGFSMIEKILEINKEQEFILISAYNDSGNLMRIIDLGITNFILKPIKRDLFNNILHKVCETIYTKKNKINTMINQHKQSILGEMLDIIAHQWLNQLSVLKLNLNVSEFELSSNILDIEKVNECILYQHEAYDYMQNTLEELRDFYRDKNSKHNILVIDLVKAVESLLQKLIIAEKVVIEKINCEHYINVNINEMKQVLINFIQNSIDAFKDNNINKENRKIIIEVVKKDNSISIQYKDFAGGIDLSILDKIFDSNVTTKDYGTGMGTYLSKIIVEKNNGILKAYNHDENGACFDIVLNEVD